MLFTNKKIFIEKSGDNRTFDFSPVGKSGFTWDVPNIDKDLILRQRIM